VLITKDGTIGKVAFIGKVLKPATLNSGVFVIRPLNESFHPKFLFYILQSDVFDKFLSQSENKILDYTRYLEKVPRLSIPGIHNRMNTAAALAVADFLKIKEEDAQKSLAQFSGTWRRLEKRGKK